jgi:hypothetical protein
MQWKRSLIPWLLLGVVASFVSWRTVSPIVTRVSVPASQTDIVFALGVVFSVAVGFGVAFGMRAIIHHTGAGAARDHRDE